MSFIHRLYTFLLLLSFALTANAADKIVYQSFFNLSKEELKIDSVLPQFHKTIALPQNYQDSIYTVELVYPEYEAVKDVENSFCQQQKETITDKISVNSDIVVNQKKGYLEVWFTLVTNEGNEFKKLNGFMLRVHSKAKSTAKRKSRAEVEQKIYADHSILANGRWAKISVAETGIHELSDAVIRRAGFSNLNKVKIYGYGGNLQNEAIRAATIQELDDLKEVPSCYVNGKRLFYGIGTVHYQTIRGTRVRNPYSDYGYYFITESDGEPLTVDETTFKNEICLSNNDYHILHEIDNYAWYHGGRNLFEDSPIEQGKSKTYHFDLSAFPEGVENFFATVVVTAGANSVYDISINDAKTSKNNELKLSEYEKGISKSVTLDFTGRTADITITAKSGGPLRLDYIDIYNSQYRKVQPDLNTATFPAAQYVYNIMNQDLHADKDFDMVIIIPTTQKFRSEADRLKDFHEKHDGLRVRVVPADELFNEFGSGTPDANAFRRYMKMLYDRAETPENAPKYLLLFGASAFDNRMLSSYWRGKNPDDYLICFESENSFSETISYANDGFFCLLDEGEGIRQTSTDREDVAVGRLPAINASEARVMVDKIIAYAKNENAGPWQNITVSMADDGDSNQHMRDANAVATTMEDTNPAMQTRRIMWDTYPMLATSTGNTYPEVMKVVAAQEAAGALIMDYSGHGAPYQLSHEAVIPISLFKTSKCAGLPIWIAAACDVLPYEHGIEYLGKEALINDKGGAIAFFSSCRSVFPKENRDINQQFVSNLLKKDNGKAIAIGEAQRRAKNALGSTTRPENKLTYNLIGDPALRINLPMQSIIIDTINGVPLKENPDVIVKLKAMSIATIKGHIEDEGVKNENFNGIVTLTVRDALQEVRCRLNNPNPKVEDTPYVYYDRTSTIYKGSAQVTNGEFIVTFGVPKDIDYSGRTGYINAFAVDNTTKETANGYCEQFEASETEDMFNDNVGPSINCYLNSPSFQNGGDVNQTPFFYAEITDQNGINTTGSGFGHDLELVVDGDASMTYNLNDNFTFDFGSYTKGQTYYSLPTLTPGKHSLHFRAWDILNNSNSVTLTFNVVKGLAPDLNNIYCTKNPARDSTSFVITHNFKGSNVTAEVEVMNMAGRPLWRKTVYGLSDNDGTNIIDWDLTTSGGGRLQTGVYLYRVRISAEDSNTVSKAKKLIIL